MIEKEIETVLCVQVPKEELPGLVTDVVKVLEKHDASKYFLTQRYVDLSLLIPSLTNLNTVSRKAAETDDLAEQYVYRDDLLYSFLKSYRALQRAKVGTQKEPVRLVKVSLERFMMNAQVGNIEKKSEFIGQIAAAIKENTLLTDALVSLGLMTYVTELIDVQTVIGMNIKQRLVFLAGLPHKMSHQAKLSSNVAMQDLFKAIYLARKDHPALDYNPLISELNELIIAYKSRIKVKATIRKNAKIAKAIIAADAKTATDTTLTSDTVAE